jgi:predicted MFS family arabinose efflux permease
MRAYWVVLKNPRALAMMLAAFPARLAYGMVALDIYFKVHDDTHSIALAGLAAGANGLVGSITTGARAAVIDRMGLKVPLRFFVPAYAIALASFDACHGATLLILFAGILGFTAPPINLSVRPMWRTAVPEDQYRTAIAIDTASMNLGVVLGPALATTLALSGHPASGLLVTAFLIFLGGISLSLLKFTKEWRPEKKQDGGQTLFRTPGFRLLLAEGVLIGFGTGNFQIAIPAISSLHNQPRFAGFAFGTMAALSILGSLLAGSLGRHIAPVAGFRFIYIFWFLSTIPLAFSNPGWSLLLVLSLFGFIGGAEQVFYLEQLEIIRPRGSAASAIGWLWTAEGSFAALGQTSGGYFSQHYSPHFCFAITSAMFGIGLVLIVMGRRWMKPFDRSKNSD